MSQSGMSATNMLTSSAPPPPRTFLNSSTPIKFKNTPPSTSLEELRSVRRILQFTGDNDPRPSVNQMETETAPIDTDSLPLPSDEMCTVYNEQTAMMGKAFQDHGCVPYWMSLEHNKGDWIVYVIVGEESTQIASQIIDSMEGNVLSTEVLLGEFGTIILPFVPIDTTHEAQPTPGRSIGADSNIPGFPIKGTCSLGGYVWGTKTKRVWALTCGHLVFPSPGPSSLCRPIHVNQPSDQDYKFTLEICTNAVNDPLRSEEVRAHFQSEMDTLKGTERRLGTIVHASWRTVPIAFGAPDIEDFALIEIRETRIGRNNIRINGGTSGFFPLITGASRGRVGDWVGKVGRSTGFSVGKVSKTKARIYHENYGEEVMVGQIKNIIVDKGDSGSFVFNTNGKVVGMLVGSIQATKAPMEGNRIVFMSAIYADIDDVLRWCSRVVGEEVRIVRGAPEM